MDGYDVVVNKPKTSAYRAPGSPQAAFGVEATAMDETLPAARVSTPSSFSLLNAAREGTRRIEGPVARRIGLRPVPRGSPRPLTTTGLPVEGENRGRGVAAGYWMNRGFQSSCVITVNFDGTVSLIMGSVDIGGTRASIAQQAAETLGIAYEDVKPTVVDTDSIGFTMVTGGSRTSFATGIAASRGGRIREGPVGGPRRQDLGYRGGQTWNTSTVRPATSLTRNCASASRTWPASWPPPAAPWPAKSNVDPAGEGNSYAVHIADVEVDPDTGKTLITRYTAIQDVGKGGAPQLCRGPDSGRRRCRA